MVVMRGPTIGPLISFFEPRHLPHVSIWIPFVRAFNNPVKTSILYELNAAVPDGTPMRVLACGHRGLQGCGRLPPGRGCETPSRCSKWELLGAPPLRKE